MFQQDPHADAAPAPDASITILFYATLEVLPERIAILDSQGRLVWANQAWHRFAVRADAPPFATVQTGTNYLRACRDATASKPETKDMLYGIYSVLEGLVERFALEYSLGEPSEVLGWYLMTAIPTHVGGLVLIHREITSQKIAEQERDRLNVELQHTMSGLHALSTLLPVCGVCGGPREDADYLAGVQRYFAEHPRIGSFGMCLECHERLVGPRPTTDSSPTGISTRVDPPRFLDFPPSPDRPRA